jgi:hypothetical protein
MPSEPIYTPVELAPPFKSLPVLLPEVILLEVTLKPPISTVLVSLIPSALNKVL